MKKMLLTTALYFLLLQDMLNRRLLSKQTGSSSTKRKPSYHFFVSAIGQKKTVDTAKFVAAQESIVKTETQQTFVNGLLGFITEAFILRWKRVCITHNNCIGCPSMANAHLHCSLIYF